MSGSRPLLALTFDDGPSEDTPAVLSALRSHGATATFFVVGRQVRGREAVLHDITAAGCELGNHTFSHPRLSELALDQIRTELAQTSAEIRRACRVDPVVMRPPFGDGAARAAPIARELGMETVMWTSPTGDWRGDPAELIAHRIIEGTAPGAVLVLHDGDAEEGRSRSTTVAALMTALPELTAAFELTTVSTLFRQRPESRRTVVVAGRGSRSRALGGLRFLGRRGGS